MSKNNAACVVRPPEQGGMRNAYEQWRNFPSGVTEWKGLKDSGKKKHYDLKGNELYGLFFPGLIESDELYYDLPSLMREYEKTKPGMIARHAVTDWPSPYRNIYSPVTGEGNRFVDAVLEAALEGDEFSRHFLIGIYKHYFKKEHNILKRFKTITGAEASSIIRDTEGISPVIAARIAVMSRLMGIEEGEGMDRLWKVTNRTAAAEASQYALPEKDDRELMEQDEALAAVGGKADAPEFKHMKDAVRVFWNRFGRCGDTMTYFTGYGPDDKEAWEDDRAKTYAILKNAHPKREYSDAEIQTLALLYRFVRAFVNETEMLDAYVCAGLNIMPKDAVSLYGGMKKDGSDADGPNGKPSGIPEFPARGDADRPRGDEGGGETGADDDGACCGDAGAEGGSPCGELEAALSECERLKERASVLEKENASLRRTNAELSRETERLKKESSRYESERRELIELRSFAYRSAQEDANPEKEAPRDEIENALGKANIAVIGGHVNWTNQLANRFPKWKFFSPSVDKSMTETALKGTEMIFFFTGHMGHATYEKAVAIARRKNIPFGYVATTNHERAVREMYRMYTERSAR